MSATSLILLAALGVAAVALVRARLGLGAVRAPSFAAPRGSEARGVRYAFTAAFLPSAKESASAHLPTYAAGVVYHTGVFAMLARLALTLAPVSVPPALERGLGALFALALACGLGLLAKRWLDGAMRAISVPDDLLANLLVDAALATALATALVPGAAPLFQLAGAALLLYAPLGKLRHMVFLFTSRRAWGRYYGRRGVRG